MLATALPELLNEGVDAVLTMAVDATLISEGLTAAKAKNVPVIATSVDVNPAGKSLFSAVYAPDSYGLGVSLADYLLKKNPKAIAVGQTVTIVYAADRLVVGAKETLQKSGGSMEAVVDADVTNLVNSFTQTTTDLALGASEGDGPDQLLRLLSADGSAGPEVGQSSRDAAVDAI